MPDGFTEEEVISIIDNIARRICRKFKFGYYDTDDIKQEARLFALQALEKYDGVRNLEGFLWVHVKNHLSNLKRNKFERRTPPCVECKNSCNPHGDQDTNDCLVYRKWRQRNDSKKNLMSPIEYGLVRDITEDGMKNHISPEDIAVRQELSDSIDENLPPLYRRDYAKLLLGIQIPKSKRTELQEVIRLIIEDN